MLKRLWLGCLCAMVHVTAFAQVPLFEETAHFSRQNFTTWAANDRFLVGDLPCAGISRNWGTRTCSRSRSRMA